MFKNTITNVNTSHSTIPYQMSKCGIEHETIVAHRLNKVTDGTAQQFKLTRITEKKFTSAYKGKYEICQINDKHKKNI